MKRILLLFSALMLSCIAFAANLSTNGFDFTLDASNRTAEVILDKELIKNPESIIIPATISWGGITYRITSIGDEAFYDCGELTSVTIPNSVTSIGSRAFAYCSGLTSITIPNSVTSIGDEAFYYCRELTSVTIPNSVTSIGSRAFAYCSGLTSITIPNSVTSIGDEAFYYCEGLKSIIVSSDNLSYTSEDGVLFNKDKTVLIRYPERKENTSYIIPNSVTSIGKGAFYYCKGLTSVSIGNSVTSIGDDAFADCRGLTSITIPNSVTSIGDGAFALCRGLTSITIPNSVTSIGDGAFARCSGLTSITIPNSVTSIDKSAFYYCEGLTSVSIGNSVTSIGDDAFALCRGLTSVTIPNSVTSIDKSAFYYCEGLTSVIWNAKNYKDFEDYDETPFYNIRSRITSFTIGNEVEHIPAFLCMGMSNLKTITIPNSVISIGKQAFYNCKGLTSVSIGNSVTSIDNYAFKYCSGLTSITIPNSVTSIGKEAFSNCDVLTSVIWNAKNCKDFSSNSSSPFYYIRSSITSFTFGNEVEHIPAYLCYGMSKLSEVTIPKSVTSIGDDAFYNCSGLTSVTIPNSVTSIGWGAFYGCSGLTSVTVGNSVTSIDGHAFYNCSGLTSVTIGNSVTSIDKDAFKGCSGLTSVIWNAKNYKDFEDYDETPFYNIRSNITSFTFGNEVEHIPAYLCYYMNNLKEVTIGNSVTSIGQHAFFECSGLTKVIYLGTIDKWVGLDWNHVTSNPTYYAKDLYINNELLTDVKITSADSIKGCAFINCQSIKSVEIGNSVTSIGKYAFFECSGLTKVNYLGTVDKWVEIDFDDDKLSPTYYAKDLYINNELLTDVKITTADSIKNYAFYNCQSIKSVEIGESVTSIGSSAFSGCDKLKKVTAYPTTVPNAYESSFAHYNAYLYVPCDVYEDYDLDDVFGSFKYIKCIAAEEVDAPEKIEIEVDEDNNAIVIWPSTDGAKKYELEISKDGEVFCTLLFNENGQLTSIDFGNRSASVGFQFTVTGLDSASKYAYSMVAMDKKGNELQSYKGTFTTNGYVPGPGEEDEPTSITETLADANITISNGHITCPDTEFAIYNTIGQDVTAFNGSLQPGVYLVSIENNIVKVMVH